MLVDWCWMLCGLFGGFLFITIQKSATILLVYLTEWSIVYIKQWIKTRYTIVRLPLLVVCSLGCSCSFTLVIFQTSTLPS
jgi:hypothetical protein